MMDLWLSTPAYAHAPTAVHTAEAASRRVPAQLGFAQAPPGPCSRTPMPQYCMWGSGISSSRCWPKGLSSTPVPHDETHRAWMGLRDSFSGHPAQTPRAPWAHYFSPHVHIREAESAHGSMAIWAQGRLVVDLGGSAPSLAISIWPSPPGPCGHGLVTCLIIRSKLVKPALHTIDGRKGLSGRRAMR